MPSGRRKGSPAALDDDIHVVLDDHNGWRRNVPRRRPARDSRGQSRRRSCSPGGRSTRGSSDGPQPGRPSPRAAPERCSSCRPPCWRSHATTSPTSGRLAVGSGAAGIGHVDLECTRRPLQPEFPDRHVVVDERDRSLQLAAPAEQAGMATPPTTATTAAGAARHDLGAHSGSYSLLVADAAGAINAGHAVGPEPARNGSIIRARCPTSKQGGRRQDTSHRVEHGRGPQNRHRAGG